MNVKKDDVKKAPTKKKANNKVMKDDIKRKAEVSDFVSSVDSPIYAIKGLPEEFIATLFAWVSRSPKGFREQLSQAIVDMNITKSEGNVYDALSEKAKKFHEKWTVGYGHSSVAEHAVVHMAFEGMSRLASAELELSSQFLSITEYSQRYQKPRVNEWFNPVEDETSEEYAAFEKYMHTMYKFFEEINEVLYDEAKEKYMKLGDGYKLTAEGTEAANKQIARDLKALEKLAFEDARYVLPLSMHTQLGVTANARAWQEVISKMKNTEKTEFNAIADSIKNEASTVVPVLLKHTTPSQYAKNVRLRKKALLSELSIRTQKEGPSATILQTVNEEFMLRHLFALITMEEKALSYEEAMVMTSREDKNKLLEVVSILLHEMAEYDTPIEAFKQLKTNALLYISEANWHQLLRHNRSSDFTFGKPSIDFGYVMPPAVKINIKAKALFEQAIACSEGMSEVLLDDNLKEYAVLNAHIRPVYLSTSIHSMYHLINLRTSEEAQWEIRETFTDLYNSYVATHPFLMGMAPRRNPSIVKDVLKGGE